MFRKENIGSQKHQQCDECGEVFSNDELLKNHMKIHNNIEGGIFIVYPEEMRNIWLSTNQFKYIVEKINSRGDEKTKLLDKFLIQDEQQKDEYDSEDDFSINKRVLDGSSDEEPLSDNESSVDDDSDESNYSDKTNGINKKSRSSKKIVRSKKKTKPKDGTTNNGIF